MTINLSELRKNVDTLRQYGELDGSEWGDTMLALCNLATNIGLLSDNLALALAQEVADNVAYVLENTEIVEISETVVVKERTLKWLDQ